MEIKPNFIGLTPNLNSIQSIIHFGGKTKIDMDEVEHITETSLTIRGSRRRTTVPKSIVDKLKLKDGNKVRWILYKDGTIVVTKVR